ncbi:GNAT family acetyltransferase [Colletotrichum tofieldiae]|nr:GNAT family acetyltransferase [Colletotrichum tofieldiae]GKT80612.1 GNAT family acetyltransferase [Colletotrichum tofieldiae]GKT88740.1 GNAT family acetyltransferase [Colletotrichum tofieldiae]
MAAIYTTVPDGLTALLEAHLPRPLPVLRRLQFTRFKGGMRPTARIIFASDSPLTSEQTGQSTPQRNFTVAYIDFGSNMETQLFMYSTLENGVAATEEERETAELQIMAALDAVRQVSREQPDNRAYPGGCLVGTLATVTRETMIKRGVTVRPRAVFEYEKWLFRVEEVPEFNVALPEGATWAPATERDCEVVISRTTVPRQVTQPPYRQRGYAKALASRLFKRSASDYGSDGWVCADVAPENLGSKGMCKSLNGRHAWNCSWNIIQLDEEEAKN